MADVLKVYKGNDVVGTAEREENGKATVTIDNLTPNTDYTKGTYKVSFENEYGESERVDVPAFKTKAINVTGVSLNKTSATLDIDGTDTLTATVTPSTATNKAVSYSSSNNDVATVDNNGKITAVGEGTADITVTTADGSKTAKCTVTVSAPVPDEPEDVVVEEGEDDADVSAE